MELEYHRGVRVTKFRHEMDALEAAIMEFEQRAKDYFDNQKKSGTEEERQKQKAEALAFLEKERQKIKTVVSLKAQLDVYREQGLKATRGSDEARMAAVDALAEETHHPTDKLEEYMRAEGVPKPTPLHTAHHIVPGKGKLREVTENTRVHLHTYGIRINDPANGVYLLHKDECTPHWSMPKSCGHLRYHTHDYERWIATRLQRFHNIDVIKTQLQVIGRLLQENEPKTAISKIKKGLNT